MILRVAAKGNTFKHICKLKKNIFEYSCFYLRKQISYLKDEFICIYLRFSHGCRKDLVLVTTAFMPFGFRKMFLVSFGSRSGLWRLVSVPAVYTWLYIVLHCFYNILCGLRIVHNKVSWWFQEIFPPIRMKPSVFRGLLMFLYMLGLWCGSSVFTFLFLSIWIFLFGSYFPKYTTTDN